MQLEKKEIKEKKEYEKTIDPNAPKRLHYNEKKEFEKLEKDIEKMEARKEEISDLFYNDSLSPEEITDLSREM